MVGGLIRNQDQINKRSYLNSFRTGQNFANNQRMENRKEFVQEFWQLKIDLDSTNPKPNMKTELKLSFRQIKGVQVLIAFTLDGGSFFVLCSKEPKDRWFKADSAGFPEMKEFCAKWLNANTRGLDFSSTKETQKVADELRRVFGTFFIVGENS